MPRPTRFLLATLVPWFLGSLVPFPVHAAPLASGGPVDITSSQLDVQQTKGLAIFTGNVNVKQNDFTLAAPKVTASYGTTGNTDIKSIEATGGVTITRAGGAERATGSTATYNPAAQTVTMLGNVTLTRGPSQLSGDKLVYDMATGNARVTNSGGPVRARFVPGAK